MEYLSYWEFYFQGKSSQGICNGRHNSRSSKLSVVFWLIKPACLHCDHCIIHFNTWLVWTRLENTEKVQFERSVDKIRVGDKAAPPDCWGVAANVNADWRQQDEATRSRGQATSSVCGC